MRAGDKVMQLKNDYERDVFNGDLGEVLRIEGAETYVSVDGREVRYDLDHRDSLTLAYASTVHKVQGSEFPAIVVVLHASQHVLLSRALLYTAVTRAKRLVVLLGDDRALQRAVRNAETYRSWSRLVERLREL
jgi:exodeoxyribonuclease V alpha subunit